MPKKSAHKSRVILPPALPNQSRYTMTDGRLGQDEVRGKVRKKSKPMIPFVTFIAALNLPEAVRLAAVLSVELRECELLSEQLIGSVSCEAAARYCAGTEVGNSDALKSLVLGYLLVQKHVLSELRVLLVEQAVGRAHAHWRSDAEGT